MKTTIINKTKWVEYCGIAGMTATEWLRQVMGYERETTFCGLFVMRSLKIGGWSHSCYYAGNFGMANTQHAYDKLKEEVQSLAAELDKRLHDLTAVENRLREMLADDSLLNDQEQTPPPKTKLRHN